MFFLLLKDIIYILKKLTFKKITYNQTHFDPVSFCISKALLKKIKIFLFFSLFQINIFFDIFRLF
jgi:hypothetical protein